MFMRPNASFCVRFRALETNEASRMQPITFNSAVAGSPLRTARTIVSARSEAHHKHHQTKRQNVIWFQDDQVRETVLDVHDQGGS